MQHCAAHKLLESGLDGNSRTCSARLHDDRFASIEGEGVAVGLELLVGGRIPTSRDGVAELLGEGFGHPRGAVNVRLVKKTDSRKGIEGVSICNPTSNGIRIRFIAVNLVVREGKALAAADLRERRGRKAERANILVLIPDIKNRGILQ